MIVAILAHTHMAIYANLLNQVVRIVFVLAFFKLRSGKNQESIGNGEISIYFQFSGKCFDRIFKYLF